MRACVMMMALALGACAKKPAAPLATEVSVALPSTAAVFEAADKATYDDDYVFRPFRVISQGVVMGSDVVVTAQVLPNDQMRTVMSMKGVGDIVSEFDGSRGWEIGADGEVRLLDPGELWDMEVSARPELAMSYGTRHAQASVVADEVFDGEPCWRVESVLPTGSTVTLWFSQSTGLERGSQSTLETQGVTMPLLITTKEWADAEGMRYPQQMVTKLGEQSFFMKVTDFTYDGPWDAVEPNEAVRALLPQ